MGPMCVSLIQQYLDNTNSSLADQFKHSYQPLKINVEWGEVLSKWREEQLARNFVYQHMKTVSPTLADEFKVKYQPEETYVRLSEILLKWKEEQLVRSLVYNHLKKVTPPLAVQFTSRGSEETVPDALLEIAQKMICDVELKEKIFQNESEKYGSEQQRNKKRVKVKHFTTQELLRIKRAVAMKEDVRAVAKEMGKSYNTIYQKVHRIKQSAGMKKGKRSAEEIKRVKIAVTNNEEPKVVARELGRALEPVRYKMYDIANDPDHRVRNKTRFSLQEDLLILDEMILCGDLTRLSRVGGLPSASVTKLVKETGRTENSLRIRWDRQLLPWLTQHYAGTTGFRVERMLTRLVADKFTDHRGIDWTEILDQHREFLGHTCTSLSRTFTRVLNSAKKDKCGAVSLQEVADYAARAYQPGKERIEPPAQEAQREAVISYFKRRVGDFGINVML